MNTNFDVVDIAKKLQDMNTYINGKYYEVEEFSLCIILSMISRSNMIVLGQPGIAKTAILNEIVDIIDFDGSKGTPYFHVQMGADISPNNVFGAPDIDFYKNSGIIKRKYEGFLPDAVIAFCSEFYRLNSQVANSGLLTILNEGKFKNGHDLIDAKLRFFMADTNFFPKPIDDIDADETDLKLQALHDRFLSRYYLKPIFEDENKVRMILMDDNIKSDIRLSLDELIYIQESLKDIELSREIAFYMVYISNLLEKQHNIFISPRRLKQSRNLIKANALLNFRTKCDVSDLIALQYSFWQEEEDIIYVKEAIYETMGIPKNDRDSYIDTANSILNELMTNIKNTEILPTYDPDKIYKQAIGDLNKLLEQINEKYTHKDSNKLILEAYTYVEQNIEDLTVKRFMLGDDDLEG
ncbi:MAG: AAA family ATPase [Acidaminobacteraceae bacterium]